MKPILPLAAFLACIVVTVLCVPWGLECLKDAPISAQPGKRLRRTVAEEVVVNRQGVYGVDFVRCRRCLLEKRRQGPLSFGGLNTLVLEDLRVVIPPREGPADDNEGNIDASPEDVARRLGVGDSFLGARGLPARFSGLRIEGLSVSRLEGTNVVPVFVAAHGEAKRDGLHMTDCVIMEPSSNSFRHATLKIHPRLRLEWTGGGMNLDEQAFEPQKEDKHEK